MKPVTNKVFLATFIQRDHKALYRQIVGAISNLFDESDYYRGMPRPQMPVTVTETRSVDKKQTVREYGFFGKESPAPVWLYALAFDKELSPADLQWWDGFIMGRASTKIF